VAFAMAAHLRGNLPSSTERQRLSKATSPTSFPIMIYANGTTPNETRMIQLTTHRPNGLTAK
jgi:hypothetical protein